MGNWSRSSAYRAIFIISKSNRYTQYVFGKYGMILINQKKLLQFHWMGHFFAHPCIFIWQYVKYTISITLLVCQSTIESVLIGFAGVLQTKARQEEKWNSEIWGWLSFGGHESCYSVRRFYLSYLFRYIKDLKLIKCQHFILTFYNFMNYYAFDK